MTKFTEVINPSPVRGEHTVKEVNMYNLPVIDMEATGRNITELRKRSGYSVRDIQNVMGFTNPQAIYKWQNGVNLPTIDNLVILAAMFGVTMDDIIVHTTIGASSTAPLKMSA